MRAISIVPLYEQKLMEGRKIKLAVHVPLQLDFQT